MSEFEELMSPAAHIKVSRLLYDHHGIYLGKYKVIHYTEKEGERSKGMVRITSLNEFLDGAPSLDVIRHANPKFTPEEIILRAKSRLDEDTYNLVINNCEHFCNWCIEGVAESKQVQFYFTLAVEKICGQKGQIIAEVIKKWVEDPHKELVNTTINLVNTVKESENISKTTKPSQHMFEKFVNDNIKLDPQIKDQMNKTEKAVMKALEIIKKM
ncbi:MAG: lecithin retinol acyltransferase family protein [Deltaproteobacteria bacterium]|jgi:hypothetical protein|nr:lecithin retinol acyltransferase family protein [Deltaproteobacteria bacterium]